MSQHIMIVVALALVTLFTVTLLLSITSSIAQTTSAEPFWTKGAPMPTPRTEVTATILEDNIYIIGGLDKSGQVTDIVEAYNIENNTWTIAAPLPEPLHHTAATSYNGKIYVVGGYTPPWSPSNKLFIYDPIQNKWQEGKPMPTTRGALNAVFVNGTIYAVGGFSSNSPVNTNEVYDPSTDIWTAKEPMPTPRHHAASAVVDGKLYVIGGRTETGIIPSVDISEAYDPVQDEWITTLESMPSKRSGIAAASVNNSIYVFGGEEPSRTFNNNEKYDVKTSNWTIEPPMPTARHGLGAVSVDNDRIYVIGGGPEPGLSVSDVNEIYHVR
jgi:N-acetylneuraminic acid mutarotase